MKFAFWLQRLALITLGIVLALIMGYIAVRLLGREDDLQALLSAPCEPATGEWTALVDTAVKDYRASCADFYWLDTPGGEFYNRIRLNNYGLHDTPLTLEKPAGVYRVLVVGDSFPQGWQVKLEEGFPWLIERHLNQEARRTIEVINLSVDSYGTDRELLLYATLGWQFQADVVLLVIYTGNDIQDNDINLEQLRYGYRLERAFFTLTDGDLQMHNGTEFTVAQYPDSPAFIWLADRGENQRPAPAYDAPDRPVVLSEDPYTLEYPVELGLFLPEDQHWQNAWAVTEALIQQFRVLVLEQRSLFAAVIIPDRRAVHAEDWEATRISYPVLEGADPFAPDPRLENFLTEEGIPNLNLTPILRGWAADHPGERLYYPEDGHFNANGHTVTAEAIEAWLKMSNLVPVG